jgi:hypothetical protein
MPYCSNCGALNPENKTFCSKCGNNLSTLKTDDYLLSKKEIFLQKWLDKLSDVGITKSDFDTKYELLSNKFKMKAFERDVIWSILNDLIIKNVKNKNFYILSFIYHEMAIFIDEEEKDFLTPLQQSNKMKLIAFKADRINLCKIINGFSNDSCETCKESINKIMTVEEALKTMPIPNINCSKISNYKKRGFCRCRYEPIKG